MDRSSYHKFKISGLSNLDNGDFDNAIKDLIKYCDHHEDDADVLSLLADAFAKTGRNQLACDYYSKALEIDPVHTANLLTFSKLKLLGPNYLVVLELLHKYFKPQRYIELGVCKGGSFSLADPRITAVGIDPAPQVDVKALPDNHIIIRDTSDNYFTTERIVKDLGGKPFDMAFLDGMHLFEYALRDFINLEKHSSSSSIILVHDLYPMNAETAMRERNSDFWSGDVWKLVLCLTEYRPDLEIKVLPCPPTGLGVITKLDATSTILFSNYEKILKKYVDMAYSEIEENKERKLKLAGVEDINLLLNSGL